MNSIDQPCILLVDDDTDLLYLMKEVLEKDGHRVVTMSSAPTRTDLERLRPAVIFLDVEIGPENGAALCHAMKHDIEGVRPVILISGHPEEILRTEAANGKADGSLAKPFNMRELRDWAAYYMGQPA